MKIQRLITLTIAEGLPEEREYMVEINRDVPPGAIAVRSAEEAHLLQRALEAEAARGPQLVQETAQAPADDYAELVVEHASEPAAPIALELPPVKHRHGRGHGPKLATLGGTKEEILTALRERGAKLTIEQQQVMSLAVTVRTLKDIAEMLKMSPWEVQHARRDAATALGFQPHKYPAISKGIKARRAKSAALTIERSGGVQ